MTITIGNLKATKQGIRCDRASPLGNPFHLCTESQRDAVIEGYRRYLWRVTQGEEPIAAATAIASEMGLTLSGNLVYPTRQRLQAAIIEIEKQWQRDGKVTLLCWCKPAACHCDVIKNYLEWRSNHEHVYADR